MDMPRTTPFKIHWGRLRNPSPHFLSHHPHIEFLFFTHGCGQCLIDAIAYPFQAHSLLVVPPNVPHFYQPSQDVPLEGYVLMFLPALLEDGHKHFRFPRHLPHHIELSAAAAAEIELVFRSLYAEQSQARAYSSECIAGELKHLMALVKRASLGKPAKPPINPIIRWAVEHIEANFKNPLAVNTMATQSGFSTGYFEHLFKRHMGMSVKHYILERRVAEARRLLGERPPQTAVAVATQSGFGSYRNFCRCFRRFSGVPPSTWSLTALQEAHGA